MARAATPSRINFAVTAGATNTIFHDVLDRIGEDADSELMRLAGDAAKAIKSNAPVRKAARGTTQNRGKAGALKRSVRVARAGKRFRQNGQWKFYTSRIVIRMRYYGFFIDKGWIHARSGNWINGSAFVTREINRRLLGHG